MRNEKFLAAVSTMIGAIVGVGIFGLPYVISQAGFFVGFFELIALSAVILALHLLYGEVILRTKEPHRFIGYAEKYLGQNVKRLVMFTVILGSYGGLLAYLIVGGDFAARLLQPFFGGSVFFYSLLFYFVMSLMILAKIKTVGRIEIIMTAALLLVMAVIIGFGLNKINFQNLATVNFGQSFLPYGVILFAMAGSAAVPIVRDLMAGEEAKIKKTLVWGTLIPAVLYALFIFTVVGISGANTTKETLAGLSLYFGPSIIFLGRIFGLLAIATSFLIFGEYLEETLNYDLKLNKTLSYLLVVGVPLIAFLGGMRNFIDTIGLVGAVAGGVEGILLVLMISKAKKLGDRPPEYSLNLPKFMSYGIIGLLGLGILYEIFYFI
ncbi:hypothetical protein A2W39_00090 [Candidatus Azambacteria bacterium RIFCSPHIGHO2_01_46_10]|uniref:Amino acid permease n=9 Tax=Candidatus Azamiibacteriota TaxID=1752741 RepID=A0A1F5C9H9_9BACT|nr:MAG: Amino acid permease [Candidatus Azambacteria bacterium GW2011_GWA2_45_90]KKU22653.1 MAG: Amino acid permease [Candidatus Azambacteria bacterium GW2011_GWC1_46_13]KKU34910.1 MAG: Amino acid permease [Candidatus Azambacteria bacterium GW2011_GWB1_46_27]KKU38128.1 MAG: Amino acid permease [Candidatus Azambacteria bacterium GW2011_GWF2_46_32]KKU38997.1 MAG: Amino acid permease [Candidatus Azambacteria bacterium GW2011_GWB2_46_37]KKU40020.1 MAG: Amino acid permease [Candidatus Azambacteria 